MQSEDPVIDSTTYRFSNGQRGERFAAIRDDMVYLNTIGKHFVAAIDRFHLHRALLVALKELYSFSACCILLKSDPVELFIIPCHPLSASFLKEMIQRIVNAANVIDFPDIDAEQITKTAYFDAPDEFVEHRTAEVIAETDIGSSLSIPLTVDNRIIGMLSLFDELVGTFDTDLLAFVTMIADYAAVALENVRLRESENALWKQAEQERQRLELILRSIAEGLLITDARGAILSLNQPAQQLFDQAQVNPTSKIPLRQLAKTSSVEWLHRLAEIVDSTLMGKMMMNQELIAGESNETVPLTLNVSAAPLYDNRQKRPTGVVAVLNDVTSHKQIERIKDEFVSIVSHELRTPLTAIKGYIQLLVRRLERRLRKIRSEHPTSMPDLPEQYDLQSLHIVQGQIEHLERLANDLLDRSGAQWGQLTLHYERFYLVDLLTECVQSVQASTEQHSLSLDIQVQDSTLVADRTRIGQVIGNLLDNAVKYSPYGGQVMVRLQEQQGEYLLSVVDEGIGISPDHFDHIFERFYRVSNPASRQYSGIGLGLYVAKMIIDRHGGRIWFSNNQKLGTTFYLALPQAPQTSTS